MPSDINFLTQFRSELQKSLLLEEVDKQYWLENCEKLPVAFLKSVYRLIRGKNKMMEKYIHTALENDTDHVHLADLKAKIKKLKLQSMEIDEKIQSDEADIILKEIQ